MFLQYCVRQGCYDGPQLAGVEADSADGISTLELQLEAPKEKGAGPDGFTALASGVAHMSMREY